MSYANIAYSLGVLILVIAFAALGPAGLAAARGETVAAQAYLVGAALSALGGGGLVLAFRDARGGGIKSAALFLTLAWCVTPVFAGLPFLALGFSPIDAYFEAASALTTTGAWLSKAGARETLHGALWRAELLWIGGLGSLAAAAAIFTQPEALGVDVPRPPFARDGEISALRAIRVASRRLAPAYVILTAICFALLWLGGAPVSDAMILALSTLSTGGLAPAEGGVHAYRAPVVEATLFAFMLIGAANFTFYWHVLTGRARDARMDGEGIAIVAAAGLGGLVLCVSPGGGGLENLWPNLFAAASAVSTTGYGMAEVDPPLGPMLGLALVGGAAISTAGGLKWARLLVLLRRVREEIWRLNHPSGVLGPTEALGGLSVWIYFSAFTLQFVALILGVAAFGHEFEVAAAAACAAIANTGPLLALAGERTGDYDVFEPAARAILALGMIAGRIGSVAALALFSRAFWRL